MKKDLKTSEAQRRASIKYNKENRQHKTIKSYRNGGINYITRYATEEDLLEFEKLIDQRKKNKFDY